MLQTLELVVRCFQRLVGNQQHIDALFQFNLGNFWALFVQQERGHFYRYLRVHCGRVVLHGLFLDDAQNLQSRALGVAHMAGAAAAWAWNRGAFSKRRLQALATHFKEAELADRTKLNTCTVLTQGIAQTIFDITAVA